MKVSVLLDSKFTITSYAIPEGEYSPFTDGIEINTSIDPEELPFNYKYVKGNLRELSAKEKETYNPKHVPTSDDRIEELERENIYLKEVNAQQDLVQLDLDLRLMEIEGSKENPLLRIALVSDNSAQYQLLKRMILQKNYPSKEYMSSAIEKYLSHNKITQEESEELIGILE